MDLGKETFNISGITVRKTRVCIEYDVEYKITNELSIYVERILDNPLNFQFIQINNIDIWF